MTSTGAGPEQVVEALEAINFLANAGRCYIVMGISPEQVMHCVGLGFREIAAEMADVPPEERPDDPDVRGREQRRIFARNYLEKLINIEVPIPTLTDDDAERLAQARPNKGRPDGDVFLDRIKVFGALAGLLAVLSAGTYFGSEMLGTPPPEVSLQGTGVHIPPPDQPPGPELPSGTDPDPSLITVLADTGSFRGGGDDEVTWWGTTLPAGLLIILALAAIARYVRRAQEDHIVDSPRFIQALGIWHPLILARTNSPRQMKRFMNRVRYFAMASSRFEDQSQPSESLIIALSALQDLDGEFTARNEEKTLFSTLESRLEVGPIPAGVLHEVIDPWLSGKAEKEMSKEQESEIKMTLHEILESHHREFKNETVTPRILRQFQKMTTRIVVR